ncbi:DUF6868 family protein [Cyanobium sp. CH-040]|uniref:DUF6868 family protein n=1 Tax=Cyanobium sp. CH-040 TaxID=2823708 RepID=UPI0020CEF61F|nr:hypothetical protein [Cyanobium sp. CH-040]MCP9928808.1 hypothetical protein [Cyanobium sp. CH-040]
MTIDTLRKALEWSTVLHYSVATIWFIAYRRHRRWYGGLIKRLFGLRKAEVDEQVFLLLGPTRSASCCSSWFPALPCGLSPDHPVPAGGDRRPAPRELG